METQIIPLLSKKGLQTRKLSATKAKWRDNATLPGCGVLCHADSHSNRIRNMGQTPNVLLVTTQSPHSSLHCWLLNLPPFLFLGPSIHSRITSWVEGINQYMSLCQVLIVFVLQVFVFCFPQDVIYPYSCLSLPKQLMPQFICQFCSSPFEYLPQTQLFPQIHLTSHFAPLIFSWPSMASLSSELFTSH